ncbi:MAG: protein phosphatase 2C domain-containing protein, partial [Psychrosphaera sp.]|nr:protein phosphatase 2C domain-containing protein [Psychrosphaera sp.]
MDKSSLTAMQGKLKLSYAACSQAGVKAQNEDAHGVGAPKPVLSLAKGVVATIADGVSHAAFAAKASAYCVERFAEDYYQTPTTWSTQRAISDCLASINGGLFNKSQSSQWLTTMSGIVFRSTTAHIFHVGDTQIMHISEGQASIVTTAHNRRLANKSSILTRALGADNHLEVDYQQLPVKPGDLFVLTSDGIHDHIDADTIAKIAEQQSDLTLLSEQLATQAMEEGSQDNLTC